MININVNISLKYWFIKNGPVYLIDLKPYLVVLGLGKAKILVLLRLYCLFHAN